MTKPSKQYERVLAIDPCQSGFGFALLEGGYRLVDWGVARLWSGNGHEFLNRLEALVDRYNPIAVVVEDRERWPNETQPLKRWRLIKPYAATRRLKYVAVPRDVVRSVFGGPRVTRHQIATALTEEFSELASFLPPRPKAWTSTRQAMNVFDALSFIVAVRNLTGHGTRRSD